MMHVRVQLTYSGLCCTVAVQQAVMLVSQDCHCDSETLNPAPAKREG